MSSKTDKYSRDDCLKFIVHADRDRFLGWLRMFANDPSFNRLSSEFWTHFTTDIFSESKRQERMHASRDPDPVMLIAPEVAIRETDSGAIEAVIELVQGDWKGDGLVLLLTETAPDRTHVKACWSPTHLGLGEYFMEELNRAYPEVEAALLREDSRDLNRQWLNRVSLWAEGWDETIERYPLPSRMIAPLSLQEVDNACRLYLVPRAREESENLQSPRARRVDHSSGTDIRYDLEAIVENQSDNPSPFHFPRYEVIGCISLREPRPGLTEVEVSATNTNDKLLRKLVSAFFSRWQSTLGLLPLDLVDSDSKMAASGRYERGIGAPWSQSSEYDSAHNADERGQIYSTAPDFDQTGRGQELRGQHTPRESHSDEAASGSESVPRIYLPKRPASLNKWKATWKLVKGPYANGTSVAELARRRGVNFSVDTLYKIVRAGSAGLLD